MLLELADFSVVLKQFNHTETSFNEDVNNIEKWLQTQTHLPEVMDKKLISSFLLLNKCRIEVTKQKIDMFYTGRSLYPEFNLFHPNKKEFENDLNFLYCIPLPKLTSDLKRITIFKIRDPSLIDSINPLNTALIPIDVALMRCMIDTVYNDVFIYDMENVPISYLTSLSPYFPKFFNYLRNTYKLSVKALYILNPKPFLPTFLTIGKKLLNPKVFNRIHIVENKNLLDLFPAKIIPIDYGGQEKSLEELREKLVEMMKINTKFFDDRLNKKVNEDLRVQLVDNENLGFYGNFKKLNVD